MRFVVYLEPAEEGGFVATVPALPGCVTQGETREEALAMPRDTIKGYLASLLRHGEPLPVPGEVDGGDDHAADCHCHAQGRLVRGPLR